MIEIQNHSLKKISLHNTINKISSSEEEEHHAVTSKDCFEKKVSTPKDACCTCASVWKIDEDFMIVK